MSLLRQVAEYVIKQGKVNHAQIIKEVKGVNDYNRCAEIVEDLCNCGIVGSFNGREMREILSKDLTKIDDYECSN